MEKIEFLKTKKFWGAILFILNILLVIDIRSSVKIKIKEVKKGDDLLKIRKQL